MSKVENNNANNKGFDHLLSNTKDSGIGYRKDFRQHEELTL